MRAVYALQETSALQDIASKAIARYHVQGMFPVSIDVHIIPAHHMQATGYARRPQVVQNAIPVPRQGALPDQEPFITSATIQVLITDFRAIQAHSQEDIHLTASAEGLATGPVIQIMRQMQHLLLHRLQYSVLKHRSAMIL